MLKRCGVEHLCLGLILLNVVGCGAAPKLPSETVVPVSGKVTIDGKPEAGVQVVFTPIRDNRQSRGGAGVTREDGSFQLQNFEKKDGVPVGHYAVTISRPLAKGGSPADSKQKFIPMMTAKESIPPKWSDLGNQGSHNQIQVPAGGKKDFEFKVTTK